MRANSTDPRNPNWRDEAATERRARELQESRDYEMRAEQAAARQAARYYAAAHGDDEMHLRLAFERRFSVEITAERAWAYAASLQEFALSTDPLDVMYKQDRDHR